MTAKLNENHETDVGGVPQRNGVNSTALLSSALVTCEKEMELCYGIIGNPTSSDGRVQWAQQQIARATYVREHVLMISLLGQFNLRSVAAFGTTLALYVLGRDENEKIRLWGEVLMALNLIQAEAGSLAAENVMQAHERTKQEEKKVEQEEKKVEQEKKKVEQEEKKSMQETSKIEQEKVKIDLLTAQKAHEDAKKRLTEEQAVTQVAQQKLAEEQAAAQAAQKRLADAQAQLAEAQKKAQEAQNEAQNKLLEEQTNAAMAAAAQSRQQAKGFFSRLFSSEK
jgi:outer membrane biosynthesis protein TonB